MYITIILWTVIWLAVAFGWIMNLVTLIGMGQESAPFDLEVVLRVIGVLFPPLGAIMGWFL